MSRGGLLALPDDLFNLLADGLQGDAERLHGLRRDALALVDQTQQYVLSADVVVVEHPGLFLGQDDDSTGSVGEPFKHCRSSPYRSAGSLAGPPRRSLTLVVARPGPRSNPSHLLTANGHSTLRR